MGAQQLMSQFVRAGQAFTDRLDRSSIGSLATPSDVFALAAATCFADVEKRRFSRGDARTQSKKDALRSAQYNTHLKLNGLVSPARNVTNQEAARDARDEVLMWWDTLGDVYAHLDHARRGSLIDASPTHLLRLTVLQHPERLSFYEVGIIDADYIQQCIANGIEADIARQLTAA